MADSKGLMEKEQERINKPYGIPTGYIPGLVRDPMPTNRHVAHLHKGTFSNPGLPMCRRGWNRDGGQSYSIWRNNVGEAGVCRICLRRAKQGLSGVECPKELTNER